VAAISYFEKLSTTESFAMCASGKKSATLSPRTSAAEDSSNKGYRKFAFNNYDALLKYGLFYNVIKIDVVKEKKAGKMKDVEYMVYGSIRYASEDAFKKKLMEDKKSTFSIYTKILNAVAAENRAKSNVDDDEESEDEIEVPVKAPKTHKKPGKRPLIVINRK
jgi:CRISPR/Cas system-associated protein endoribonuclease Cas2